VADWHQSYNERYKKAKAEGKSFFPYVVFKDALVALLILCVLGFVAWKYGAGLEPLADPTDTTYNPRPEWYFLFLFQALKAFPGNLEPVAAIFLPGAAVGYLLLLPFLDRGPKRHPFDRPLVTGIGVGALLFVASLTVAGLRSPLINPVVEKDPLVTQGERIYRDMNCAYCHSIRGKGGAVGPQLDRVVGNSTEEWLMKHFRDPRSVTPGSTMPQLNLFDDEIRALTAYMKSIGAEPYTKDAKTVFADNCAVCHMVAGEGGEVGPDLSAIGSARDKAFIKMYISDPTKANPKSTMPAYAGQLTDVQIEDVARYLSSLGR
jgi:ubiquinol-cytochrome c reductase cytochrome b subunit